MINPKLLRTLEDRLETLSMVKLSDKTIAFNPECDDLYSFVASVMYNTTYSECCEWKDDKPYPEGKERRDRVKQFLMPIVAQSGGIEANDTNSTSDVTNTKSECNSYSLDYDDFYPNDKENSQPIDPCKLAYILLSRGILTSRDFGFLTGHESFDNWKKYNAKHKNYIIARMIRLADIDED